MKDNNTDQKKISIHVTGKKLIALLAVAALWGASLWVVCNISEKRILKKHGVEENLLYPLLNPRLRNYEKEERLKMTFPTLIPLRKKLVEFLGDKEGNVSFYIEDLNGGTWSGIKEKEEFTPASLLKVPVVMGAMKKVDEGKWTMEQEFSVEEKHRDKSFGDLWQLPIGTKLTLKRLIEEALQNSDNTATKILFYNLTPKERDDIYYHIGFDNPENSENEGLTVTSFKKLSTRNLATIFRALYNSTYLTRESSSFLLDVLTKTKFEGTLSNKIPLSIKIAHKIATVDKDDPGSIKNFHDCGIAFLPNHSYLYCFMTRELGASDAMEVISGMNGITYEHFSSKSNQEK